MTEEEQQQHIQTIINDTSGVVRLDLLPDVACVKAHFADGNYHDVYLWDLSQAEAFLRTLSKPDHKRLWRHNRNTPPIIRLFADDGI